MDKKIYEMLKKGIIIGGRISHDDQYVTFERLNLEELLKLNPNEMAFATHSMGRSIFVINSDGEIINYKGVNSELDNEKELSIQNLVKAKTIKIPNPQANSNYSINLMVTPDGHLEVRFHGASPLEDLEIEADINKKMQEFGIKLPQILKITELTSEFAEKIGLPIKIPGSYDEFSASYDDIDKERKTNLHQIYETDYFEEQVDGYRPELMSEYFERYGIADSQIFKEFAAKYGKTIDGFLTAVDEYYALGQRYGQTVRKIDSPFRIADLEAYIKSGDIDSIDSIAQFTQSTQQAEERFENVFARNMGTNCAKLMNAGWLCENFVHRQDFTLTGEMCDDTYYCLKNRLEHDRRKENWSDGKYEAIKQDRIKDFFAQIQFFASTVKVLIDEMDLRRISKSEKLSVIEDYTTNFANTIDLEQVSTSLGMTLNEVYNIFQNYLCNTQDFVTHMSKETREKSEEFPDGCKYNDSILIAHEGNNGFYKMIAKKIADQMNLEGERQTLTAQEIGEYTAESFSANPKKASEVFQTVVEGVKLLDEVDPGKR